MKLVIILLTSLCCRHGWSELLDNDDILHSPPIVYPYGGTLKVQQIFIVLFIISFHILILYTWISTLFFLLFTCYLFWFVFFSCVVLLNHH